MGHSDVWRWANCLSANGSVSEGGERKASLRPAGWSRGGIECKGSIPWMERKRGERKVMRGGRRERS